MRILSIETSCDDTGISILEATGGVTNASFKVLADNVSSQIAIHIPYGGVFPALAKREHIKNLPVVLEKTLKEAKLDKKKKPVDLIAVTSGPGLEPALWTGIVFARELAKKWKVPIVPVNHMEGHVVSVFGTKKGKFKISKNKNPTLALLVSGGHTELVLIKKPMSYEIIGQTVDDAVGEAFDKVARMLGLPYPGGPEISKMAEVERGRENESLRGPNFSAEKFSQSSGRRLAESPQSLFSFSLPRPMLHTKNFDFSYSGLKTAVLYLIRDMGGLEKINEETKRKIALEFENAAIDCLVYKTSKAIEKYSVQTLIVAGGVSANKHLQSEIKKVTGKKIKLLLPPRDLTGDNALMIGISGYLNFIKNKKKVPRPSSIKADGNLRL
ncbi:MAG: tRNA (adenosine(37)-N6)-threonylcarbamoyltransferase complex transferase subunit TsaD [Candidatus Pacebacteria bacterium]|nr:tRNA (adenosine(37)-N6)-threonylcarbamoyltransferase complex transferase subunit TsaD [Candidatus Paceibacterota bacterium]